MEKSNENLVTHQLTLLGVKELTPLHTIFSGI